MERDLHILVIHGDIFDYSGISDIDIDIDKHLW